MACGLAGSFATSFYPPHITQRKKMPQEQKQPKKQRDLTPQEIETAASFTSKWTPEQLRLIWKRKMPPEASMEDFQLFLYICDSKSLNPLLGEVIAKAPMES